MQRPAIPANEPERLKALRESALIDVRPDPQFDALTALAAEVTGIPRMLVNLVDGDRQFCKAHFGMGPTDAPRDVSFCGHVVAADAALVVPDARLDPRFSDNPFVIGEPHVRFYAGFPLRTQEGYVLGTLCGLDVVPRELSERQSHWLTRLAAQVTVLIESHRLMARERLRATESEEHRARLESVLASANFSIISTDLEGRIQTFSAGAERLTGYAAAEMLGLSPGMLHDGAEVVARAAVLSHELGRTIEPGFGVFVERARLTGAPDEQVWTYVRKDGSRVPVRLSVTALRGTGGELAGYVGIAQDLSQQRAAEQYAEQLLQFAPNGLLVVDRRGTIRTANVSLGEMFGYTQDQLLGQPVHRLVPARIRDRHPKLVEDYVDSGLSSRGPIGSGDFAAVRADGTSFYVDVRLNHVETPEGPAVLAAVLDVTSRVAAHERTTTQLAVLRGLSRAPDVEVAIAEVLREVGTRLRWRASAFYRVTTDGEHLEALQFWSSTPLLEFERATMRARFPVGVGLPGECWKTAAPAWSTDLEGALHVPRAGVALAAGMRTIACFPVIAGAAVIGVLELATDEVRPPDSPLMDALQVITTAIGQFILRREAEVALIEARAAAEHATRTKSRFLANMSHEIRTPMNAVLGMAHLLLKTDMTARQRDYVSKIASGGRTLLGIINDILDFSKIEAGKLELDQVSFNLDDLLGELSNAVSVLAADKGLELVFDVPRDVPRRLVGDPLRLHQVLLNLCSNAIKFTSKGEVVVSLRAEAQGPEQIRLWASVRDTGIGMTSEQAAQLFQAFSQADASTTRKYGGTGLGLSISKGLVELMGGTISVRSQPSIGSTFRFCVLVGRAPVPSAAPPPQREPNLMRALVIDDNDSARMVATEMLSGFRFQVDSASDGRSGIAAWSQAQCDQRPYDLIVLDWRMPGMDGLEVARHLVRQGPTAPIVMVTAHADDELSAAAAAAGVAQIVSKPYSASSFHDAVRTALGPTPRLVPELVAAAIEPTPLLGARVLLVEDNEINQQIAVELLERAGAIVAVAGNGREALAAATPDLDVILMDLQMPIMDGFEATRALLARPELAGVAIVAMTANAMVEDRAQVAAAGMKDFVAKPIDPEQLVATVQRWVRPRAPGMPSLPPPPASRGAGLPPALPGLDLAAALIRVGGNEELLVKLLRRFRATHVEVVGRIGALLAAGDRVSATREAHTLKGIAGTLGAADLARCAAEIEASLGAGRPIEDALGRLGVALREVLEGLAELPAEAGPAAGAELPAAAFRAELARLRVQLAEADAAAAELAGRLAKTAPSQLRDAMAKVAELAERFEFDDATAALDLVDGSS